MLRSPVFGKVTAYTGILANLFGLGYYVTLAFAPTMTVIPLSASAPFLLIWYILIGRRLLQLGVDILKEGTQ
jgi:xanthine/uracil/vitamin C permease (AzgA family)